MWNIARSAEAMFSRWVVKRFFKYLLKKKLGHLILGDIDADQLDVQLGDGTVQLSDLALNVDYINQKIGTAAGLIVREGSIGFLSVKMPWKGDGCHIEADEIEIVLTPCVGCHSTLGAKTYFGLDNNSCIIDGSRMLDHEMVDHAATSDSVDVCEGVKTVAKMVKWLLTSFHVKMKRLLVAFDPCLENAEKIISTPLTMIVRITEAECGTSLSDNVNLDPDGSSLLGISVLTNFIKFQGAVIELLQMDEVDNNMRLTGASGSTFGEFLSGSCSSAARIPVLSGKHGGFSGNLNSSIPWKNGSLDVCKVDLEVKMDPLELKLQPRIIKWLILTYQFLQSIDGKRHKAGSVYYNAASHLNSSIPGSSMTATDKVLLNPGNSCVDLCSETPKTMAGSLLPGSNFISDWVPFSNDKEHKENAEADFSASVIQFFDCFDEMRSSQSASSGSGIWNWTSSVFSAITAASNLATGSLQSPEQQYVHNYLRATLAGISIVFSFDDEDMTHLCFLNGGGDSSFASNAHFLGGMCQDVSLVLQVCPQEIRVEATVMHIEIADYFSDGIDIMKCGFDRCNDGIRSKSSFIEDFQAEVQHSLPPFAFQTEDPVAANFPYDLSSLDGYVDKTGCENIKMNNLVKVTLFKSSHVSCCQCTVSSSYSGDGSTQLVFFSLELPPFVLWVDFNLMCMLLDCWKEVGNSFETKKPRDDIVSDVNNEKHDSFCPGTEESGCCSCIAASSPKKIVQGNMTLFDARLMLCFPFENSSDSRYYFAWEQFIALNFSSSSGKSKVQKPNFISHASASHSLNLNVGKLDLYLVTSGWKGNLKDKLKSFSSHSVLCVGNEIGSASLLSMMWQESSVTGPWLVKRVKDMAVSGNLGSKSKVIGKGHEFASITTMKDVEDTKFCLQQELVVSSMFFLHAYLPPLTVNLHASQYKDLHCLFNQITDGLSCVLSDSPGIVVDSSISQMSVLVECDSVEIIIYPDMEKVPISSMQRGIVGSWQHLKLEIQKFELLSVSNIGRIRDACFFWVGHEEGKLWGSVIGAMDEELLLISCCNSTMRRGDGGGSNVISCGLAGSDIMRLWDPQALSSFTSITVRCCTIVAIGGCLDWFDVIYTFFHRPCPENDQIGNVHLKSDSKDVASFVLNLVDIGLSYEPYFRKLSTCGQVLKFNSRSKVQVDEENHVACLLAAASLSLSNENVENSICNDYKIRVRDLGLLLSTASWLGNTVGLYSAECLHKYGYIKVAREAFLEATLRTNCENDLLWELECSESDSHIIFETCHDTTTAFSCLIAQLQQLFSPDVEESALHLQNRWNNVWDPHDKNNLIDETPGIFNSAIVSSSCNVSESEPEVFCLMDEICEDAFHAEGNHFHCSDSCESQGDISHDGISFPESLSVLGPTSFLDTEIVECFYKPELMPQSPPSTAMESLGMTEGKSRIEGNEDSGIENGGWYGDAPLRFIENYFSEMGVENAPKQFMGDELSCPNSMKAYNYQRARGRILLKNINFRWRLHAGSDWVAGAQSSSGCGRDKTVCLEFALCGIDFQYTIFPEGQMCASKLVLSVQDFNLYDDSKDAPWKLMLGYYDSKEHPRESSSKAFKLDLEAVRPDPSIPLDEYRVRVAFLPLLVHLHQVQLDFLINFFGGEALAVDQSPTLNQEIGGPNLTTKSSSFEHKITELALLPYFQKFDVRPVIVRVDYTPSHIDLSALRGGKYVELVNLVPWKGVELQLKQVHAVGVYGWSTVFETIVGDWLEDISQNQIHKLLRGLPTVRSLVAVGSGAAKLIYLPVQSYQDQRLVKGMQRGLVAFVKSISLEAVGLGLHLAAGAHEIFQQAEYISIPSGRTKNKLRSNQPKDVQQGFKQACERISDGLGRSASALVQIPLRSYQSGAGAGSALAAAVRAAPAAAIAPASAAAGAAHAALLGVRNSLDPEHKRESMEKYGVPNRPLGRR